MAEQRWRSYRTAQPAPTDGSHALRTETDAIDFARFVTGANVRPIAPSRGVHRSLTEITAKVL
jgi:hypothetical protein